MDDNGKKPFKANSLIAPIVALLLEFGCVGVGWLGTGMDAPGLLLMLIAFFMPIAGMIIGAVSIASDRHNKPRLILSILALIIPPIAVAVTIILLSAGVFVIALM